MKYVLLAQSYESARKDAGPFVPNSMVLMGMYGVKVFGPYDTQKEASNKLRMFPGNYNLSVEPLHSLSEELDNPAGSLWWGDSPDE